MDLVRIYRTFQKMMRHPHLLDAIRALFLNALVERGLNDEATIRKEAKARLEAEGKPVHRGESQSVCGCPDRSAFHQPLPRRDDRQPYQPCPQERSFSETQSGGQHRGGDPRKDPQGAARILRDPARRALHQRQRSGGGPRGPDQSLYFQPSSHHRHRQTTISRYGISTSCSRAASRRPAGRGRSGGRRRASCLPTRSCFRASWSATPTWKNT